MSESRPQLVLAGMFDDAAVARAGKRADVVTVSGRDEDELRAAIGEADALIVRTGTRVTGRLLEAAPRLRVIGRAGAGVDNIELAAAARRNITVVHTPDASTEAVADLTVGLMIAVVRHIAEGYEAVRAGADAFRRARRTLIGPELGGLTLGIIGLGRIGKAVARRCRWGFGMRIVYHDIVRMGRLDFVAEAVDRKTLLRKADVVSLHVPLTEETRGMIDGEVLGAMRPEAVLINTARGEVVDGQALARALHDGRLAGAGLDVFDPEPPPPDHPILSAPRTVLTPHLGARTPGSLARMEAVIDEVLDILEGKEPRHAVDFPDPKEE